MHIGGVPFKGRREVRGISALQDDKRYVDYRSGAAGWRGAHRGMQFGALEVGGMQGRHLRSNVSGVLWPVCFASGHRVVLSVLLRGDGSICMFSSFAAPLSH